MVVAIRGGRHGGGDSHVRFGCGGERNMNELEKLREEAASFVSIKQFYECKKTLNRAIEIAEKTGHALADCWSSHQAQKKELDQACADVLKLREVIMPAQSEAEKRALADTEHYEKWRVK